MVRGRTLGFIASAAVAAVVVASLALEDAEAQVVTPRNISITDVRIPEAHISPQPDGGAALSCPVELVMSDPAFNRTEPYTPETRDLSVATRTAAAAVGSACRRAAMRRFGLGDGGVP